MPDIDADYIIAQHTISSGLYTGAISRSLEVEKLFKGEFGLSDQGDHATPTGPHILKPAKPRAILDKYLTLLSIRASHTMNVIAKDNSPEEQEKCSNIERWLSGYQRAYQMETQSNPWRSASYWALLRGRGCLETRFDASRLGTEKQVIRTLADDPNTIFSVWGRDGIGWYTKEYTRWSWDLKNEIDRRHSGKKKSRWAGVELPDENCEVTCIEYWNDDYCGAVVRTEKEGEPKLLYVSKHDYGFVPLAEAHFMDTPLAQVEWSFQSVLEPIMDTLKVQFALAAKMAAGVDLFYWPTILVTFSDGRLMAYDGGTIRAVDIPPGVVKVDVIAPSPNEAVLAQLMAWLKSDEQLGSIPDIAWGAEPNSLQSGFAIGQVLGQVKDKIADKQDQLEQAFGWQWGHVLRLLEKFGGATGAYTKVPVEAQQEYGY